MGLGRGIRKEMRVGDRVLAEFGDLGVFGCGKWVC